LYRGLFRVGGCNPNPPFRSGNLPRPATYDFPEASILHRFGSLLD